MGFDAPELEDQLMATGFASLAFQIQLLVTLAKKEVDPKAFVTSFIAGMHQRIDFNDAKQLPNIYPHVHEIARQHADMIGQNALQAISSLK